MDLIDIAKQLEALHNQTDTILKEYHECKTAFENLDKQEKTVLAQIANEFDGSEAQRNRQALANDRYRGYKDAVKIARGRYNRSWALLEGLRLKMDILRSLNKNLQ